MVKPASVPNEMESKILKSDRYILVGSSKWHDRNLRDILKKERIVDFYDSDKTTMSYLETFNLDKHVQRSRIFVNENEALVQYITAGVGYGTLTETVAKPRGPANSLGDNIDFIARIPSPSVEMSLCSEGEVCNLICSTMLISSSAQGLSAARNSVRRLSFPCLQELRPQCELPRSKCDRRDPEVFPSGLRRIDFLRVSIL